MWLPSLSRVAVKTRQVHGTVLKSTLAVLMHLYSLTCKRSTYRLHEDCCTLVVSLSYIKGKIFLIVHRTLGGVVTLRIVEQTILLLWHWFAFMIVIISQMKRGRNQRKHVMRHQEFLLVWVWIFMLDPRQCNLGYGLRRKSQHQGFCSRFKCEK